MTKLKYSHKTEKENIAKAMLRDAPISTKHSIEICARIRYKKLSVAKEFLEKVIKMETPVKITRFTEGAGHKKATGPGKYPVKAAEHILSILKSAESNALDKGLGKNLKITHLSAQQASRPWHYGRQRRIKMKRTHIELVLSEVEQKKKPISKQETKPEVKETKEVKQEKKSESKPVETKPIEQPKKVKEEKKQEAKQEK